MMRTLARDRVDLRVPQISIPSQEWPLRLQMYHTCVFKAARESGGQGNTALSVGCGT